MLLNPEKVTQTEAQSWPHRKAVRAVLADAEGRIALLHVSKQGYYKLPGGGIDTGEDLATALNRECLEEAGCAITMGAEIGTVEEWRNIFTMRQHSVCFHATVKGPKGTPHLEPGEEAEGFKLLWVSPAEALNLLRTCTPKNDEGKLYIVPRDIWFLEQATA